MCFCMTVRKLEIQEARTAEIFLFFLYKIVLKKREKEKMMKVLVFSVGLSGRSCTPVMHVERRVK